MAETGRNGYPPPNEYNGYSQSTPPRHDQQRDEGRSGPPPPPPPHDPHRQGQYPAPPSQYQPPAHWAGQPQGQQYQHHPPPPHNYEYVHPPYHYPPPAGQPGQPPMHPDYNRLPPVYPPYYGPPYQQPPQHPAPRQRTAIACKYCRKRKIRCSGYDSSPDGRCMNCVRFNQQCLFHPVSSQAAFVPASALYGPNARAPVAGQEGQPGQNGQPPAMLYGAHGQPLGPAGPGGQPQYNYPPPPSHHHHPPPPQSQGYPPAPYPGYPPPPANYHHAPPPINPPPHHQYDAAPPPPTATSDRSERGSLKRPPPDEEGHENNGVSHPPHPNNRARHTSYEGRSNGSYDYQNPTSPATSTMSYQSYHPQSYTNGAQPVRGNNSPPSGLTPNSIQSLNSPHATNGDNRTPPPMQPGSAGSSQNGQNGRSGMSVHEMLGNPNHIHHGREQRIKSDNDMLNKLDGKK